MGSREHKDKSLITLNISPNGMLMPKISQDPENLLLLKCHLKKWWLIYVLFWTIFGYLVLGIINISFELFLSDIFWKQFSERWLLKKINSGLTREGLDICKKEKLSEMHTNWMEKIIFFYF